MNNFPIGFWNYMDIANQDASGVRDWSDAGMTLALGPNYDGAPESIQKMRAILDAAHERSIQVILCDRRSTWHVLREKGEDAYRKDLQDAIVALGSHPAVSGFHVGDEPDADNFPFACRALRIHKELAPHLSPFCNLLPWYPGVATAVGYERWASYLDAYVDQGRPDFLCYDCYMQMTSIEEGWDIYFKNLREFHEAAVRHRVPFWTTLLSVGHFRYRCPREDDLRWQINTAVAHGARGLLWFFFYMQCIDNYRVSPIDEHGERSETFEWLSRANRSFLKMHAPVIKDLTLEKVSHAGRAWGGVPLLDGQGRVFHAASRHGPPLIVSEFRHAGGAEYVAVVNNSQTDSTQIDFGVRGRQPRLYRVGWMAKESLIDRGDGWSVERGDDFVCIHPWLAPGQMELYRIEEPAKP